MKKSYQIITFLVLALSLNSCMVQKPYVSYDKKSAEPVRDKYGIYQAIKSYPVLEYYYDEGVIDVVSVTKVKATYLDEPQYIIRYNYCKHYITDYREEMEVLKENFPELYELYCNGKIVINELYEYVGDNGNLRYHISYRHNVYQGYGY